MSGMSLKRARRPFFWGLFSVGVLVCVPVVAQEPQKDNAPLKQPSVIEAVDTVSKSDKYWSDISIANDAGDWFLINRSEARVDKRSRDFETVYKDIMKQQNDDRAIIRTQDLPNLYGTSLLEMQK
jgi:hypothetical protein